MVKQWLTISNPLNRWGYGISGLVLLAIKYNGDRLISYWAFDRTWYFTDYFTYLDLISSQNHTPINVQWAWVLALTALPFIGIGTVLTLRRLRDAGLPGWMVCFFFFPAINLLLFAMLCLLPTRDDAPETNAHRRRWLDRWMPISDGGSAVLAIGFTAVLGTAAAWFSVSVLGEYGWSLFLGIPYMQGLAAALIFGYHSPRSFRQCCSVALLSVVFLAVFLVVFAVEGLVCIAMAAPLALPMACLGGILGYYIQKRGRTGLPPALVVFAMLPLLSGIERQETREPELVAITTEVLINQPRKVVWDQLVTFNNMEQPKEWLFKMGIAYPVKAIIDGKGAGSIRRCQFTTGDFIEPITVWDEPNLLSFSVKKMPPPLVEWSIYKELQLPHLEGYFISEKGEFRLTALSSGQTRLQGTTWYRHNIWPRAYWRIWSDYILHTIHRRVLNHIKIKAEANLISTNHHD